MIGERDVVRLTGTFAAKEAATPLSQLDGIELVQVEDGAVTVAVRNASSRLVDVFHALAAAGAQVRETTVTQPSLESLFIKLTGKDLRE
jgi:ABC-2 type transport system ATP-binding protein